MRQKNKLPIKLVKIGNHVTFPHLWVTTNPSELDLDEPIGHNPPLEISYWPFLFLIFPSTYHHVTGTR